MSHPAPHPTPAAADTDRLSAAWAALAGSIEGELHRGTALRQLYATDASEYQELPAAVALPKSEADVGRLLAFARRHRLGLITRGTGTSLAGQVVGSGIVMDVSRHLNRVLSYDHARRTVRVQPGVVRNELNRVLLPHGVLFAPETATANRATIGGMVGNNSCGGNSIVYGATRDHLVSARGFLSDGSPVAFGPLTAAEFAAKCTGPDTLETRIYRLARDLLADPKNRQLIRDNFPKATVTRRNTGYALDALMDAAVFDPASAKPFNLCRMLAGSEGTLFIGMEFELNCEPLPPPGALLCAHFDSVNAALKATLIAMQRQPFACELIDRLILECTKGSLEHEPNRLFVHGDPAAVLVVELRHTDRAHLERELTSLAADFRAAGLGYAFPLVWGADCERVWHLRRAGQGLLQNVPGDAKPREVVEDTAVAVEDLPAYIAEFDALLRTKYGVGSTYYAHAGAGELHTRPLFNLKSPDGLRLFRGIATDVAALVKKYRGSLSGEHGDGRLRGEFIPFMVGPECYAMMRRVKETFDPLGLLNPGKIIDTPPMDTSLRHGPSEPTPEYATIFDFSATHGVFRATEQCNGNGECRKTHLTGGTMCPSYMATRNEQDTTRARANQLRHVLTHPRDAANPWDSEEIAGVMDLCLSCKGCKSECPSNVDVSKLKAEWQQHYHDTHGVPFRSRLIAGFAGAMRFAARAPRFYNWVVTAPDTSRWIKQFAGFAEQRSLPPLHLTTLAAWHAKHANKTGFSRLARNELAHAGSSATQARESLHDLEQHTPALRTTPLDRGDSIRRSRSPLYEEGLGGHRPGDGRCPKGGVCRSSPTPSFPHGRVYLFCDEFTNYSDTAIGIKAVELLNRLGYEVIIPEHVESGRAQLSKGLVRDAQALAIRNVELLKDIVSADTPLIGLEPSAILGFRDEFPDLMPPELKAAARTLAQHALLFEEFIAREATAGRIRRDSFRAEKKLIRLHGHCHQKAMSSLNHAVAALELPAGHEVRLIASGCCGMAGSFGYEAEHFALSQQIGELVLFPTVRAAAPDTIICAPGTSCRHQIKDGTGRIALHPAEILHAALV